MKVKVFMRSIRESFTTIFEKYHCKGMIMPLFLLAFLFNGMLNADFVPANATRNSFVDHITTAISDKKQSAEHSTKLKKSEIATLPEETPKTTYTGRAITLANTRQTSVNTTTQASSVASTISIAGRVIPIFSVGDTSVDSGSRVAHYGSYFYYGHRSTVFGFLAGLPAGTEFTVNLGGISTTYRISRAVTLDNATPDAEGKTEAKRFMPTLVNGNFKGAHYDAVLMTCAGAASGGITGQAGDAESRTAVLATRV